ncbi:MAG TPA: hypothetical protein VGC57_13395 [Cellulomonas sp.]
MAVTHARTRKTVVLGTAAALTVLGAGAAFAYWTSTGSGNGEAATGASTAFLVTTEPAVGEITPGGPGQTIAFTVSNPGTGTQNLSAVTVTLADESGVAWVPAVGCEIADYTVAVTTPPAYGAIAAAGTVDGTVTVTLLNTGLDQDACQGLTVPVHLVAS